MTSECLYSQRGSVNARASLLEITAANLITPPLSIQLS